MNRAQLDRDIYDKNFPNNIPRLTARLARLRAAIQQLNAHEAAFFAGNGPPLGGQNNTRRVRARAVANYINAHLQYMPRPQ